jgi:predicted ATPase/class 3 adenylate cyclase
MSDGAGSRTLTFVFTDIEGSTRLWEQHGDAMRIALAEHDDVLRQSVEVRGGTVVKTTGDGMLAVFDEPVVAIASAIAAQHALDAVTWGDTGALRVRMAVHCGPATERDGDYFGTTLNRAARLMALAHGGQIVTSETVALLVREVELADGAQLRDLGEHRLRDLSRVERVYQIDAVGLTGDFAALRSLDAYSTNLPSQLTSFIGREDDVAVLTALVRAHRFVTLTGVGGVGKTRLALRIAAEVLPDVRDGVWLCELAAADAEEAVLEIVTRALGVMPRPGMSARDSILDHLRGRDCLIVLDNCEHLVDIVADLTDAILRSCQHVRVLATSREGLGIDGEQLRPIRSLPVPELTTAAAVLSTDATTLFAERAAAVAPAFRIDDTNAPAVVEICRRLDGIPLAIELAAARVASLQPTEIAALLDERFRLLTGSRRKTIERHQTLRATVDWSYSLLRDEERTVFDRLGTFVGSFDTAAAQSVVADDSIGRFDVLDALGELVAKSMLAAEPAPDGTTRYQLLETLRQYALERLEQTGEVDTYRRRHAEHYVTVTAELGRLIYGPDEVRARARLDRETDNLRAAVDWSIDAGESELVCGLIVPIAREAAWNRGSEVGGWAERALVLMGDNPTPWQYVRHAAGLKAQFADSDMVESLRIADSVLADPDADVHVRLDAHLLRTISLAGRGDVATAVVELEDVCNRIAEDPTIDPRDPTAITAGSNFAIFLGLVGQGSRAVTAANDSLQRAQEFGGPSTLALAHFAVAFAHLDIDPGRAMSGFEESLRYSDLGASNIARDRSLNMLAVVAWRSGDMVGAAGHLARALRECLAMGDNSAGAYALQLAVAILGDGERWQAALAVDTALTDGTLPDVGFNLEHIAEARARAVAAARDALGAASADRGVASRDRDAVLRYAIAELERLSKN